MTTAVAEDDETDGTTKALNKANRAQPNAENVMWVILLDMFEDDEDHHDVLASVRVDDVSSDDINDFVVGDDDGSIIHNTIPMVIAAAAAAPAAAVVPAGEV
jgi:hypothetical protein